MKIFFWISCATLGGAATFEAGELLSLLLVLVRLQRAVLVPPGQSALDVIDAEGLRFSRLVHFIDYYKLNYTPNGLEKRIL